MTATKATLAIKDGAGFPRLAGFLDESGAGQGPFDTLTALVNAAGALVDPATTADIQALQGALAPGSTGVDFSINKPALPLVGASTFGGAGPYAAYVLIGTIPAAARGAIDIENISGAPIAVLRDDGVAPAGVAPTNASVFALAGGAGVGAQGGAWSSTTFRGRVQIYAPTAGAIVTVMQD